MYPLPLVRVVNPTIPLNPWERVVVIVAIPEEIGEIDDTTGAIPNFLTATSTVSLVILFLRSLVATSPRGDLFATLC